MALALVLGGNETAHLQLVSVAHESAVMRSCADMDPGTESDVQVEDGVCLTGEETRVAHHATAVHVMVVSYLGEVHRRWFAMELHRQRAQHGSRRKQVRCHRGRRIGPGCGGHGNRRWERIVERCDAGRTYGAVGPGHRQRSVVIEARLDEFAVVHRRDEASLHR